MWPRGPAGEGMKPGAPDWDPDWDPCWAGSGCPNEAGSTFQRATCFPFSCRMAESEVKFTAKKKEESIYVRIKGTSESSQLYFMVCMVCAYGTRHYSLSRDETSVVQDILDQM